VLSDQAITSCFPIFFQSVEAYILDFLERTVPTLEKLESDANMEDIATSEYEK